MVFLHPSNEIYDHKIDVFFWVFIVPTGMIFNVLIRLVKFFFLNLMRLFFLKILNFEI